MVTINASRAIEAPLDQIWEIVSNIDNDPKYWQGLNSIKNISKKDNVTEREVIVGFRNSKARQTVILNPKKSIEITMTEGPIIGTRVITLNPMGDNKTKIDVSWDVKKWNVPFIAKNKIQNHVTESTTEALNKIAAEAE